MNTYRTIKQFAECKIEIDKSTFIGLAYAINNEDEIPGYLQQAKTNYPNANHYVYAYTCGRNQAVQKFSDDGEPSGTGGLPILEIFKYKELEDVLVIVVRYFGGIKLGTGGLKRAYSKSALEALQLSQIIKLTLCRQISIKCPYNHWGRMQYELESKKILVDNVQYQDEVFINAAIPLSETSTFKDWISGMTASQAKMEDLGQSYREVKEG